MFAFGHFTFNFKVNLFTIIEIIEQIVNTIFLIRKTIFFSFSYQAENKIKNCPNFDFLPVKSKCFLTKTIDKKDCVAYRDMKSSPLSMESKVWKESYANGICVMNSIRLLAIVWLFMRVFPVNVRKQITTTTTPTTTTKKYVSFAI